MASMEVGYMALVVSGGGLFLACRRLPARGGHDVEDDVIGVVLKSWSMGIASVAARALDLRP